MNCFNPPLPVYNGCSAVRQVRDSEAVSWGSVQPGREVVSRCLPPGVSQAQFFLSKVLFLLSGGRGNRTHELL